MVSINVSHNFADVQRKLKTLRDDVQARALASAVNKTADQAKTQMVRQITADYALTSGYVRERLSIRRASFRQGTFAIEAELLASNRRRSANVIAFVRKLVTLSQARRAQKRGKRAPELQFKFKRSQGFKAIPGAFVGNKGRTVFIRQGKSRLPIEPVQVIDVPQMFNSKQINGSVVKFIRDKFPEVFAREAKYFADRFNQP